MKPIDLTKRHKIGEISLNEQKRLAELCAGFTSRILAEIDIAAAIDMPETGETPHIAVISFENINGEMLAARLLKRGIHVITASPCTAPQNDLLAELKSLDVPFSQAMGAVKFSLGPEISADDIDAVVTAIKDEVVVLKNIGGIA